MPYTPASIALQGLVVLDLTRVRSGPTCVRQFADWGADVIKIEMREGEPGQGGQADFSARHEADFQNLHRNKRSLALDLKNPQGLAVLKRLAAGADIVVENYRPDVKTRLGIDYEALSAENPRLIYASISGFGQDGPYAERPGVDQIAQGMSGLMSVTGEPGRGPMRAGVALADLSSGLFAALGIMVALQERNRSGRGQWVQTSLLQAQMFMLDFQGARYLMQNEVPGQAGNNHPTGVPTGVYPTSDGHINLAPTPPMWRRFCQAIGQPGWADNPDYATPPARRAHREEINGKIAAITRLQDSTHWVEHFNRFSIPCGPIYRVDQAFDDPQVKHLGIAEEVESKSLGPIRLLAQPVALSRTPSRLAVGAPEYAADADEILAEYGYNKDEIAALRTAGAI
jgi:crotonobetainyl-CoA:carnitine CoA-transferase CaiB-like acyl-CoA transferase